VLNEPCLLELSNALFTATSTWLIHLASSSNDNHKSEGEEQMNKIKKLPLKSEPNRELSYIPEFIMENIIDYLKFLGRYNLQFCEVKFLKSLKYEIHLVVFFLKTIGPSINEYVNLILVFMGDASRLRNPHLRATLADVLEIILPQNQHGSGRTINR